MADTKIRDDNFCVVYGWMLNRLHLKGVALQIFAIIYGFDRDGEGSFTGSLKYLMNFTNTSKNTVLKALKELVEKRYILKAENTINGKRVCTYRINALLVQKVNQGGEGTAPGDGAEIEPEDSAVSEHNNEDVYSKCLIDKKRVQDVIDLYNTICISLPKVTTITENRKRKILSRLRTYSLEGVETVFRNVEKSAFLKGNNKRGWCANFDWMLDGDNFVKILEGNYIDREKKEFVPGWTQPILGDAELEAIQRVLQEDVPSEDWTCES